MMPMAIGFGEGGGQSAPLARAVIGGLIVSTFATLTILAIDLRHPPEQGIDCLSILESDGPDEPIL